MAKARARAQARKVKDKWKAKQWYSLLAPPMFNQAVLAETPSEAPEHLVGRIITTTLQDLTGDFKTVHIKLDFQVAGVEGSKATTRFIGHSLTSDYVRRMVRRSHSKIGATFTAKTKDGAVVKVKPFAITDRRCQGSQKTLLRHAMDKAITTAGQELSLAGFLREVFEGKLVNRIYKQCKPIYPLRRVEVGRTQVTTAPTSVVENDVKAYGALESAAAATGEEPKAFGKDQPIPPSMGEVVAEPVAVPSDAEESAAPAEGTEEE